MSSVAEIDSSFLRPRRDAAEFWLSRVYQVVELRSSYIDSVKAWRFILRDSVWDIPGVIDVTTELRAAELSI